MQPSKKPDLAILIGHALAKKGKSAHDPMEEEMVDDSEESDKSDHMLQVAEEMLVAIESKDAQALADLLMEVHECMMSD